MRYRRHGARLFGLLTVAALSVMALAAASAQAVTPKFLVNATVEPLEATFGGEQEGTGTLLVPGLNFKISCTAFTVDEGKINTNTDAKAVFLYTGCTTLSITKSPEEIACEVVEPVKVEALLLPAELTNGEPAVLAEKIKALINLTKPKVLTEECILPFDNVVKGEICLKIKAGTNDTVEPLLLSNDSTQKECKERATLEGAEGAGFKDKLLYGSQEVTVDDAKKLKLTGSHVKLTLGVSF